MFILDHTLHLPLGVTIEALLVHCCAVTWLRIGSCNTKQRRWIPLASAVHLTHPIERVLCIDPIVSPFTMCLNQFQRPPVSLLVLQHLIVVRFRCLSSFGGVSWSVGPFPCLWMIMLISLDNLSLRNILGACWWLPVSPINCQHGQCGCLFPFYSDDSPLDCGLTHWGWLCSIHVYFLYVPIQEVFRICNRWEVGLDIE